MNARKLSVLALAVSGLFTAGVASAQVRTYNFNDRHFGTTGSNGSTQTGGCNTRTSNSTSSLQLSVGNSVNCREVGNSSTTTLNVTGWSTDGTTPALSYRAGTVNDQGSDGFGMTAATDVSGSPNHAADNMLPGGVDLFLLNFITGPQALKSVSLGWTGHDGDFQVLRWTGAGSVSTIAGKTASALVAEGWELMRSSGTHTVFDGVGHTSGSNGNTQTFSFNDSNLGSTSWIISAYNSAWGGTGFSDIAPGDAIKVLGVTTGPARVSAPGTLALAGLGLLGAAFLRRRT